MIEFVVHDLKARGKERPRFNSYTHRTYTPKKTQDYEKAIKTAFLEKYSRNDTYLSEPLECKIKAFYKIPTSYTKKKRNEIIMGSRAYQHKPDVDNIAKAILDALNGLAYKDDNQIVKIKVEKIYDEYEDFIEIQIKEYKGD